MSVTVQKAPLAANRTAVFGHLPRLTASEKPEADMKRAPKTSRAHPQSSKTKQPHYSPTQTPRSPQAQLHAHNAMKSSPEHDDVELLKAVAQAWHAQSGNRKPAANEAAGARRGAAGRGRGAPSRFKLEAAGAAAAERRRRSWDFAQSLWDSYELVAVAQKLEASLVVDPAPPPPPPPPQPQTPTPPRGGEDRGRGGKRARESRHSLWSLFRRSSSKRFESGS